MEKDAEKKPCCICHDQKRIWDRIGKTVFCANCEEDVIWGKSNLTIEAVEQFRCAVCFVLGIVPYETLLRDEVRRSVEIDLCEEHLRDVLGRRLDPDDFRVLRKQLERLGLSTDDVFLLHSDFYYDNGRAREPIPLKL